jgi:hypothetical protein
MSRTPSEVLTSYVTDMRALEAHIDKALEGQIEAFKDEHPQVTDELRHMRRTIDTHDEALLALCRGTSRSPLDNVADAVKRFASIVAGLGAAAIDLVRHERLPKDLRDDYTAMSLAAIGYEMLQTTAEALNDGSVAVVAERHHADYVAMGRQIQRLIPGAVLDQLRHEGLTVNAEAVGALEESYLGR